ncbi:hypothetical protein ASPWEDRAFT_408944 [Aspergillus wentii DTO 134E9]|uniref:Protein EFR3 n=1 Tax=Aspergillus wentii DTO 134E9 TaxID=1073089 RepID=A0A1L9RNI6_ASPWE|nr:uncharacterized protein ASPWEDRAFT_408944 [Aspergillus wentii DTO 134E9]KAI9934360.1 plasma membrane localization protein [Aspergillus wentii]OJJ36496.1 hypothetical protein ASPWEDRAFT_408944 [Aspergillus wentii DTO 134E9]
MEGVRQSCRPKHQVLTLKCYPRYQKGVQEVKPNPSELSYLLYYVSTRRSKLTKVGAFLEKRAARDVWRRRLGNVQVTLEILTALIEKVPRDLPIYARSVLTIIETVLRSHDISMVEDSIPTFETFCQHQDMAALAAEQEFSNQYWEVVRTYASFASTVAPPQTTPALTPQMAIRWRNAGLRAIKGVVSSEEGLAAGDGNSLKTLLPVILENLYTGEDDAIVSLQLKLEEEKDEPDLSRRRRVSNATVQTVDTAGGDPALASQSAADADRKAEIDVRLLALRCLERIVVSGSNRGQIRTTTKVVLRFILDKGPLRAGEASKMNVDGNWASSLMELIAKWCPVQVRFIMLITAMELLLDTPPIEKSQDQAFTILFMINWLLKSPANMIGLSVMDILLGLVQYLSFVLVPSDSEKPLDNEKHYNGEEPISTQKRELLSLVEQSIGSLATHIYYGDQVFDMIRTILTRFKPSRTQESAIVTASTQPDAVGANAISAALENPEAFNFATAKITALRAIKNILTVATLRSPAAAAGVESRNHVGIHVWEGTQWFLREPEHDVRHAYIDAFLTWLNLETNESDLQVKDVPTKPTSSSSKRDFAENVEKPGKRNASTSANQRERATLVAESNFLRLLHLTVYDAALQCPTEESEIAILHLVLTSLVNKLGVNAIRFGLPMILKLQDDMATAESLRTLTTKVNIGSLVYGYLWALSEKFDLEVFRVGSGINKEVQKRQQLGLWVQRIRVPSISLDNIVTRSDNQINNGVSASEEALIPFHAGVDDLIHHIEESYNSSMVSPVHSPPGSPGQGFGLPSLSDIQEKETLPLFVKEQMMSTWSREACLATVEKETAKSWSMSGSKAGTLAMRNQIQTNGLNGAGDSSQSSATSPTSAPHGAGGIAAGLQHLRRMSVPESSNTPPESSNRGSPVRVNELRRVLSVNKEANGSRKLSPLRGRLHASNGSIASSSSESMVSGYAVSEMDGDGGSSRPPSTGDGTETPKASTLALSGDGFQFDQSSFRLGLDDIPPVPPIPPSLSVPGGFPNDSQRSLSSSYLDRPSTSPNPRKQYPVNGTSPSSRPGKTLSRNKSRSSNGLAMAAVQDSSDDSQRRDLENLLNGFLSPSHAEPVNGKPHSVGRAGRRRATGGIGRPPY